MANEQLVRKLYQCINERDLDGITALTHDNCRFIDVAQGKTLTGKNAIREDCETWLSGFPDGTVQVLNVIVAGDNAVVEFLGRGTHTASLGAGSDALPPTYQHVELSFCEVLRFEGSAIASVTSYYDAATLMRQLKLLEQPAKKPRPEARPH